MKKFQELIPKVCDREESQFTSIEMFVRVSQLEIDLILESFQNKITEIEITKKLDENSQN